ncbi:MAG: hypothetical protein AAFZ65_00155 [Planctomycetota bacterium]
MLALLALALPQVSTTDALVVDLNTAPSEFDAGSRPNGFISDGQRVLFSAFGPGGRELWVSDGSFGGTVAVDEATPGPVGSVTFVNSTLPVGAFFGDGSGRAVVNLESNSGGREPWAVDALTGTITALGDLAPGDADSEPASFVAHQGEVWFLADDGTHGRELWRSDGTPGGTQLAVELVPGPDQLWLPNEINAGRRMVSTGSRLVVVSSVFSQLDLIATDGTPGGTQTLLSTNTQAVERPFADSKFTTFGGRVLFGLQGTAGGAAGVWVSDGTVAGTVQLVPNEEILWAVADGSRAFFATADDELYVTDGTVGGTTVLMAPGMPFRSPSNDRGVVLAGELYLSAWAQGIPGGNVGTELCATDGTVAGTRLVVDLLPGASTSNPRHHQVWQDGVFFTAFGSLWRSDGTSGNAQEVTDPSPFATKFSNPDFGPDLPNSATSPFFATSGALVYPRRTSLVSGGNVELWRATPQQTQLLADISPPESFGSSPQDLVQVGDLLFFSAGPVNAFSRRLYVYDTSTGVGPTELDIPGGAISINPVELVAYREGVAFGGFVDEPLQDGGVWWTDGSQVIELLADPLTGGPPSRLTVSGERLFFLGSDQFAPSNLWFSDGAAGDAQVVSSAATEDFITWSELAGLGDGRVVGRAVGGSLASDFELAVSDGTPEGTFPITVQPGPGGSFPQQFVGLDGRAFFQATQTATGTELWVTDGTVAGTQLVQDFTPGPIGSGLSAITPWADGVVYTVQSSGSIAVYLSDGTAAGTGPLVSGNGGGSGPYLQVGDRLFFPWGGGGEELWVSDGTPGGTAVVPGTGAGGALVASFGPVTTFGSNQVAFAASVDGESELWVADGTASGTQRLTDFSGAAFISPVVPPRWIGSALYLVADDFQLGEELFAIPLATAAAPAVQSFAQGCGSSAGALEALDLPLVGSPFGLRVESAAPSALAALFVDLDLLPLSIGTCTPLIPAPLQLAVAPASPLGVADFPLALPANPALLGLSFYLQAATIAPGEPFLGVASLTNVLNVVPGQ